VTPGVLTRDAAAGETHVVSVQWLLPKRLPLMLAALVCGLCLQAAAGAPAVDAAPLGSLRPIMCKSSGDDCIDVRGLNEANVSAVEVTPDGRNVYATSTDAGIAVLRRNWVTGALRQLPGKAGCLGPARGCTAGHDLDSVDPVVVSPDGRNVYALGGGSDLGAANVLVFRRDPRDGSLLQLPLRSACLTAERAPCQAVDLALTRLGRHVYATPPSALTGFARDPGTGALRELPRSKACLVRPDAAGAMPGCRPARAFSTEMRLSASPDGRNLYLGVDAGMALVQRERDTGALTQLPGPAGCMGHDTDSGCAPARVAEAGRIVVSPGGGVAYVQAFKPDALFTFRRDRSTGVLAEVPGPPGCLTSDAIPDCRPVRGGRRADPVDFTLSPGGRSLYAAFLDPTDEPEFFDSAKNFVASFGRVSGTGGQIRQLRGRAGCAMAVSFRGCARVRRHFLPQGLVVTRGGRDLIVASWGLRVFRRAGVPARRR
jgi:hypothetical protein